MDDERPRPEQTYFKDPAIDRLMGVVMALAGELYVTRDRLRALERLLEGRGQLQAGELDRYAPSPAERAQIQEDRDAFVRHLMENLLGEQKAKGPL